jgi:hypothetical protein
MIIYEIYVMISNRGRAPGSGSASGMEYKLKKCYNPQYSLQERPNVNDKRTIQLYHFKLFHRQLPTFM